MTALRFQTGWRQKSPACLHSGEFCTLCCPNGNFSQGKFGLLSPRKASCNRVELPVLINYEVHAGSFRVSIIRRTLTRTTGSLTCVRDPSYACVYTRGRVSATFLTRKNSHFSCAPDADGVRTSGLGSRVRRSIK